MDFHKHKIMILLKSTSLVKYFYKMSKFLLFFEKVFGLDPSLYMKLYRVIWDYIQDSCKHEKVPRYEWYE